MTLCWECAKAGGHCSWSKYYIPVKGWKAVYAPCKCLARIEDSYEVQECPQFEPDRMQYCRMDDEGVMNLRIAIIGRAVEDYKLLNRSTVNTLRSAVADGQSKRIQRFFKSGWCDLLTDGIDRDTLLELCDKALKKERKAAKKSLDKTCIVKGRVRFPQTKKIKTWRVRKIK